jgi:hypothetical protein
MNDLLDVKISSRFIFVNIIPAIALAALIGGLLAAGAPRTSPNWSTLQDSMRQLGLLGGALLLCAVVVFSLGLHPLSYLIIQMLEGYWERLPGGRSLQAMAARRYERWRTYLRIQKVSAATPPPEVNDLAWLPVIGAPVLPTRLGNTLRAGEIRAGQRFGYETGTLLPRLLPVVSSEIRTEVTDCRNQLDTAARLCVVGILATPATLLLLWTHGKWLLVPLGCYLFAWMSYQASIAASRGSVTPLPLPLTITVSNYGTPCRFTDQPILKRKFTRKRRFCVNY